ncbi:hypothetical protein ACQP2T_22500 [Nonomuraea sp. CA-143628]|uniref:hypothetical protein n=1 Tax=Nonomuraea sp. CA-143628 TaxID=3239997 RepID=UPI003D8C882D
MSFGFLWDVLVEEFGFPALVSLPYAAVTLWLIRSAIPQLPADFWGEPFLWVAPNPWIAAVIVAVIALVGGIMYLTLGLDALGLSLVIFVELVSVLFHFPVQNVQTEPWLWVAWSLQTLAFVVLWIMAQILAPPPPRQ